MKSIRKIRLKAIEVELMPNVLDKETMYISREYNCMNHICPCGCGQEISIPLNRWAMTENNGKFSFGHSLLNTVCKAHYVIKDNIATILP